MTQEYIITEDEMNWIKNDCRYPHTVSCEGCEHTSDGDNPCTWKGANILMDEIIETRLYNPQAERGKVLDELDRDIPIYLSENPEGTIRDFIDFLLLEFRKLRQQGKQEAQQ